MTKHPRLISSASLRSYLAPFFLWQTPVRQFSYHHQKCTCQPKQRRSPWVLAEHWETNKNGSCVSVPQRKQSGRTRIITFAIIHASVQRMIKNFYSYCHRQNSARHTEKSSRIKFTDAATFYAFLYQCRPRMKI